MINEGQMENDPKRIRLRCHFSSIFESTFANADAPKFAPDTTSAFLSTPDQNMNEIMALLDNF